MRILVDSSVLIDALRDRRGRREWLHSHAEQGHDLTCCAVNVAEVYAGMRPSEAEPTHRLIEAVRYVYINRRVARRAGELRSEWQRKGKTLSLPDTMIAALVLEFGLALATDNRKHFPMGGITFADLPES